MKDKKLIRKHGKEAAAIIPFLNHNFLKKVKRKIYRWNLLFEKTSILMT